MMTIKDRLLLRLRCILKHLLLLEN